MRYRWLHLSDLHSICSGIRTSIMRESLIDELNYINQLNKFDFVMITGDISDKNKGYDDAKTLIHRIINTLGIRMDKVFLVPGNHDLSRQVPFERESIVKTCWGIELLDKMEDEYINLLIGGQNDFFSAYEEILGRSYPVDKMHFSEELDENVSIIHLNTAWMCFDSENESGKLHIGLNRVFECLNEEKLRNKQIKIAIGHHRMSDFNKTVEGHLNSVFKSMDVDLYLGGHCHSSTAIFDPIINTEFCSCRQARAEEKDYPAGFIIGEINTETDQSYFQFYNWDSIFAKWTYDYTVNPAKHGKYYLRGEKFTKIPEVNRNIIVDLKLFGISLDYETIMKSFGIRNSAIYKSSIRDIRPKSIDEWNICLRDIKNIYETIIKNSSKTIHVFPIAAIPFLVAFGYFIQNDNPSIRIYQYFENENKWVYDEHDDNLDVKSHYEMNNGKQLVLALSISASVEKKDIEAVISEKYDLLSIGVDNPMLSLVNYSADVQRVKTKVKSELDKVYSKYEEIHLFIAAPAGLCIEVGRLIRENMYPSTYIYNYERSSTTTRYAKIFDLKKIRDM